MSGKAKQVWSQFDYLFSVEPDLVVVANKWPVPKDIDRNTLEAWRAELQDMVGEDLVIMYSVERPDWLPSVLKAPTGRDPRGWGEYLVEELRERIRGIFRKLLRRIS